MRVLVLDCGEEGCDAALREGGAEAGVEGLRGWAGDYAGDYAADFERVGLRFGGGYACCHVRGRRHVGVCADGDDDGHVVEGP